MTDRLKIGQEVLIHGYVDEIRKDTIIIQNEGGYFGTVECEVTDIDVPDTDAVLNKIREEIAERMRNSDGEPNRDIAFNVCLKIIDKYKAESEDKK